MWERVSSSEKRDSSSQSRPSLRRGRSRSGVLEKFRISSAISSGERTKSARPRVDDAAGHAVELGAVRVLGDDQPAHLLHRLDAVGAVGPGAGEDHGDGVLPLLLRQGGEEGVDGGGSGCRARQRGSSCHRERSCTSWAGSDRRCPAQWPCGFPPDRRPSPCACPGCPPSGSYSPARGAAPPQSSGRCWEACSRRTAAVPPARRRRRADAMTMGVCGEAPPAAACISSGFLIRIAPYPVDFLPRGRRFSADISG